MAIEFTQHPSSTPNPTDVTLGVMRLRIPRLKLAEASSLRLTHRSLDIEHYTGPKKINPPDLADVVPSQTDIRLLSASLVQAQNKDAAYYSHLRTDDAVEWSGFNSLKDRAQVDAHRPKTLCVFGPLIDSPPAQLSDDTDVFVLLVYWCKKADVSCAVQMERWNGSVLDINATVTALGDKCRGLLGMHALSGCDTVSYPNGRGKVSALRVLTQTDIDELDSVLGEESATQTDLPKAGTSFFLSLYCQKESTSLNAARHDTERGRIRLHWNRFPQPTRTWHCTCRERICKCYYGRRRTSLTLQIYNWLTMAGKWRNMSTWCLPFLGSLLHHRSSWTSSAAAAKRRVKPVVEGVAVGLVDYRAPATVSVKEGIIAVIHILNRRRTKTSHSRATWILMILWGKRVTDWACDRRY